jgi:beta-mannosidase
MAPAKGVAAENPVAAGRFNNALDASVSPAFSGKDLPGCKGFPLTVELWCKLRNEKGYNILVANEPKASASHWEVYVDPAGKLCAYLSGVDPSVTATSACIKDGQWHYAAMQFDGREVSLYVDGKECARSAVVKKADGNVIEGSLCVGGIQKGGTLGCNGLIDEVRISNCLRPVSGLPDAPFESDAQTAGLWHFDRMEGALGFADASQNGNTLKMALPGMSLNEIDRISYHAGSSPLDSSFQQVSLQSGSLELPKNPSAYSLDGVWQLVEGGAPEERLTGEWINPMQAPVPGSVHLALYQAGTIPYPYLGKNQDIAQKGSYKTYYCKTTFPRAPKGADQTLVFDGICNKCTVWLNGRQLGEHEGMFTRFSFPVGHLLQDENTLIVKLDPAIWWRQTVVFNNSYGWHYAKFPPLGIWGSVGICGEPAVRVENPFVVTRDAKTGAMDLVATLAGPAGGVAGKLEGVISPENFKGTPFRFECPVETTSARQDIHLRFAIPDPQLWWPVDLGRPNLYKLKLAFLPRSGDGALDVDETTFGIRTIEMKPVEGCADPDLFNWTFVVNGQPVFVKGSGWCTMDAMMEFPRERYDRFLSLAADQHIQLLRAWGMGMVETDDFYDLCDRKGIMVMQEWPTGGDSHLTQPPGLLEETVRQGILRLRSHPSLVLYAGGNELKNPYGEAIDRMGRLGIELDGTRDFHRGEPYGGSVHDYKVYWGGRPIDRMFTMNAIFYGEFGIASYPDYESVQKFLPDNEKHLWPPPEDGSFAYHTPKFNTAEDLKRITRMSRYFTDGSSMERFITGSQLAQAVGVRHVLERARTRWPKSTGALYYKLNDNCPAASWSTVDWYGAPKISHYLIQDSFAPLTAVVLFPKASSYGEALSAPVYLLDDANALDGVPWEVRVRAYGEDLQLIKQMRFAGQGPVGKVKSLGDFALDERQTKTAPLLMVMDVMKNGTLFQRNYNFTHFEPKKDCLFDLPKTQVEVSVDGGRVMVRNGGKVPAVGVHIDRPGHLDAFSVDDNYFWLDVNETKTVAVNSCEGIVVDGWNIDQTHP